jgi:putative Holliday junction resolvase
MVFLGRFLGVDYGTKRIGLAISDENLVLAFPKEIIQNDKNIFKRLGKIIKQENISEIVIGESTDFSGKSNPLAGKIEIFILELQERFSAQGGSASGGKLPVRKQKEFLTSVEARRYQVKSGRVDASAAALILQRYLDKINKSAEI